MRYLRDTLPPDVDVDPDDPCRALAVAGGCCPLASWTGRASPTSSRRLGVGDRDQAARQRDRRAGTGESPTAASAGPSSWSSIPTDPWPPTPRGRSRRKANRSKQRVDVRRLPSPAVGGGDHRRAAEPPAGQPHVPGDDGRRVLRRPATVRGRHAAPSRPAPSGERVGIDRRHRGRHRLGRAGRPEDRQPHDTDPAPAGRAAASVDRRARTWPTTSCCSVRRRGNRPSQSNWSRALKRACGNAGHRRDPCLRLPPRLRHADDPGRVPLAEAARRLGHSVETLVSTYIGAMDGDDTEANTLIDEALASTRARIVVRSEAR